MTTRYRNRIAIVTGGASGIGAATTRRLADEGATVIAADIDIEAAERLAASVPGGTVSAASCDVSSLEQLTALIDGAVETYGQLDLLVSNAGVGISLGSTPELDPDEWRCVIEIDLHSVYYGARAAIPHMRRAGSGAIVNTASISGLGGDYGFTAYNAAKGAVVNYTRALAIDHAREGIRINAVCPGLVDTALTARLPPTLRDVWVDGIPAGRACRPEEVAAAIAFLGSDDASFIMGAALVVDGGQTAATGQPNVPAVVAALQS